MRLTLSIAGFYGASALALKAFARHGLEDGPAALSFGIAADMQLMHAVLLFAIGWMRPHFPKMAPFLSAAILAGVALFCVPIYIYALFDTSRAILALTPGGGILLIAGWAGLAVLPWLPASRDDKE